LELGAKIGKMIDKMNSEISDPKELFVNPDSTFDPCIPFMKDGKPFLLREKDYEKWADVINSDESEIQDVRDSEDMEKSLEQYAMADANNRMLPVVEMDGKTFFYDQRLNQLRRTSNPHEHFDLEEMTETIQEKDGTIETDDITVEQLDRIDAQIHNIPNEKPKYSIDDYEYLVSEGTIIKKEIQEDDDSRKDATEDNLDNIFSESHRMYSLDEMAEMMDVDIHEAAEMLGLGEPNELDDDGYVKDIDAEVSNKKRKESSDSEVSDAEIG